MQSPFPYAAITLVVSAITVVFVTLGKNIFDSILLACQYLSLFVSFFFSLIDKNCGQRRECSAGQYHWGSLYPRVLRHDGILGGERTDGESCGTDRMVTHRVGVHE